MSYSEDLRNQRPEVMVSSPIVLHVLRPYANEEDYLAHERSSIDAKTMLLIDQPHLPVDTFIVFDVQLENGEKPIRAEARVIGHEPKTMAELGGLRVRFRRFGAKTKAFIDRASAGSAPESVRKGGQSVAPLPRAPSLVPESIRTSSSLTKVARQIPAEHVEPTVRRESSGTHRIAPPVPAPTNREELLSRLRTRASASGR